MNSSFFLGAGWSCGYRRLVAIIITLMLLFIPMYLLITIPVVVTNDSYPPNPTQVPDCLDVHYRSIFGPDGSEWLIRPTGVYLERIIREGVHFKYVSSTPNALAKGLNMVRVVGGEVYYVHPDLKGSIGFTLHVFSIEDFLGMLKSYRKMDIWKNLRSSVPSKTGLSLQDAKDLIRWQCD